MAKLHTPTAKTTDTCSAVGLGATEPSRRARVAARPTWMWADGASIFRSIAGWDRAPAAFRPSRPFDSTILASCLGPTGLAPTRSDARLLHPQERCYRFLLADRKHRAIDR